MTIYRRRLASCFYALRQTLTNRLARLTGATMTTVADQRREEDLSQDEDVEEVLSVDEAEEKAGLLHHHFPCMAAMGIDDDYGDTLMHISGNILKDNVGEQVKPFKQVQVFRPDGRSE